MTSNNQGWKLKDALMIAICSVLFGILLLGATYAGGIIAGILTPAGLSSLGYEPFYGIYFMPAAFALYIMRKPGTGVITEIVAAIIETLLGNFFGPMIILSGLVQGIGIELPIALRRYKRFDRSTLIIASVVCSVLTLIYNIFLRGYNTIAAPILILMLAVRIVSAIVFCAIITPMLCDRLAKAGVLRGYAISDETDSEEE